MSYCTSCGQESESDPCAACAVRDRAASMVIDPWASLTRFANSTPTDAEWVGRPILAAPTVAPLQRTSLVLETWFVMLAFLLPAIAGAVIILAKHVSGITDLGRFPSYIASPGWNLVLGIFDYLSVAAIVPVALLLLARTGQPPSEMGMGWPRVGQDLLPGLGIAAKSYGVEILMIVPFVAILKSHPSLITHLSFHHVPAYYVMWGLAISAITSITEEVFVNGYLITRLYQLGWTPRAALILSLALRTSYHVYYGLGFLLTVPLGYFVTRSFQKHRRLNRAIAAHFLFDAVITTIAILVSR